MKDETLQKELPDGLQLGNELPDVLPVGQWFSAKDSRLNHNVPVDRTICFLEIQETEDWENDWASQLLSRTDKLSSTPLKYVAYPLEVNFFGSSEELVGDCVCCWIDFKPLWNHEQQSLLGLL